MKVFLSYTTKDREQVKPFYDDLSKSGFSPWMDVFNILPGMTWDNEIKNQMSDSDVCLIFISENSLQKTGYVQKELKYFTDKLQEMPENYIFCIPVILDESKPQIELIKKVQYINIVSPKDKNWQKVLSALQLAASQRNIETKSRDSEEVDIELKYDFEVVNGINGYQFAFSYPHFSKVKFSNLSEDLNDYLTAKRFGAKVDSRILPDDEAKGEQDDSILVSSFLESKIELNSSEINYQTATELRIHNNLHSTICDVHHLTSDFISFVFETHWYGSGAAHGNLSTEAINFRIMNNKLYTLEFWSFFKSELEMEDEITKFFQNVLFTEIQNQKYFIHKDEYNKDDDTWLKDGIQDLMENYFINSFSIGKDGWLFHFDPYQIDCFAAGKYEVTVPHHALAEWYKKEYYQIFNNN